MPLTRAVLVILAWCGAAATAVAQPAAGAPHAGHGGAVAAPAGAGAEETDERWHAHFDALVFAGYNYQRREFTDFFAIESQNWFMAAARRRAGASTITLLSMFSLEPFTLQDLGSPQVFQTGETFQGAPLIDYQHPHDLVMALGGRLERPVKGLRTLVEASLVGTPALGPPPFMHRPSAADNPQVPLSHHGLDSTHISSSVLTGGAWWRGVALEASWFHGKEPDENRLDLDLGPPDSWAARLSWASGPWRLQASGGRLTTPEVLHPYDETRLSASIGYDSAWRARPVSMLLAWGQKREPFGVFDNYLIEAHVQAGERDALFTRAEIVTKAILGGGIHAPGAQHFHPALEDRRAHRRLRARPHRRAAWPHRRGRRRHRLPRPGQPHRQLRPAALVPRLPALRRAAGTRDAASLSRRLRPRLDARRRRHVACAPGIRPTIRQSSLASPSEPGGVEPMPDRATREELIAARVAALVDRPDFPTFSQQIEEALHVLNDEDVSAQRLAELVLRNYALTLKVLRAANSFMFNRGGVPIFSVAQAIFRLGIDRVRAIVGSLMYFEHFHTKTGPVKELVVLSLVSANHAAGAAAKVGSPPEEAYLCGMLRNLGEVLVACYFPDDYERVLARAAQAQGSSGEVCERELGFTFEDLGREMVRRWGMPDTVASTITSDLPDSPRTAPKPVVLAALAHGLTSALYRSDARDARARMTLLVQKLGPPLGLSAETVKEIADAAASEARRTFARLQVRSRDLAVLDRSKAALAAAFGPAKEPAAVPPHAPAADPRAIAQPPAAPDAGADPLSGASQSDLFQQLTTEVDHVIETRAGGDLHAVLLMVLEAVQRGGSFDRVLFGLVTPDKQRVQGRLAIGSRSEPLKELFAFPLSMQGGPIGVALARQQELLLRADWELRADEAALLAQFGVRLLGVLPLSVSGVLIGCLYFDRVGSSDPLSPDAEAGVRRLRDRAVSVLSRRR